MTRPPAHGDPEVVAALARRVRARAEALGRPVTKVLKAHTMSAASAITNSVAATARMKST